MFRSDFTAKRTRDSEAGWELLDVTSGPGYARFELHHSTLPMIQFWGQWLSIENIDGLTPLGHRMCRQVFEVRAVDAWPGASATVETKQLIADALLAYGCLHNGPLGPVDVLFAD